MSPQGSQPKGVDANLNHAQRFLGIASLDGFDDDQDAAAPSISSLCRSEPLHWTSFGIVTPWRGTTSDGGEVMCGD
jgi:hypothetical protein